MPDPKPPTHDELTAAGKLGRRLESERAKQTTKRLTLLAQQADQLAELEKDGKRRLGNIAVEFSATVRGLVADCPEVSDG
jgi:hypothetical protein